MNIRDYKINGYEYFGYGIDEIDKAKEADKRLRDFLLKRKKAKGNSKEKPRTPIGFKPQYGQTDNE